MPYPLRTLAINITIFILLAACLKSSTDVRSNHCRRYCNHEFLLLPGPLRPSTLPWRISCCRRYLLCLIRWPKYSSFLLFTVKASFCCFPTLRKTSSLVMLSVHDIRRICRFNHISKADSFFISCPVMVHASASYNKTGNTFQQSELKWSWNVPVGKYVPHLDKTWPRLLNSGFDFRRHFHIDCVRWFLNMYIFLHVPSVFDLVKVFL